MTGCQPPPKLGPGWDLIRAFGLALLVIAASVPARAEEAGTVQEKPRALNEVEHGFNTGGQFGVLFLDAPGTNGGLAVGTVAGVSVGFDITSWIGIELFLLSGAVVAPNEYAGLSGGTVTGDFTVFLPGGEVKVHVPLGSDSNGVNRLYLDLGAGLGALFPRPTDLIVKGPLTAGKGDLGIEYFTHLRHLSLGLRVDGFIAPVPSSSSLAAFGISPFIRYSF
jgi:hypothetical protein